MPNPEFCWLNGQILPLDQTRIHPLDRGLLFADGLFETMRAYLGRLFLAEAHLARLRASAKLFQLHLPFSDAEITAAGEQLLAANALREARLRLTLTRGIHTGVPGLPKADPPTVLMTAEPISPHLAELQGQGVTLALASVVIPRTFFLSRHKTLSRLPYLLARESAGSVGAFDSLLLDEQGLVAETTIANLFLVQGQTVLTPPLAAPILPGITRAVVLELARDEGLTIQEKDFALPALFKAQEIFITNSIIEVLPVVELDTQKIGAGRPGPVTRRLQSAYQAWVRNKGRPA